MGKEGKEERETERGREKGREERDEDKDKDEDEENVPLKIDCLIHTREKSEKREEGY